MYLRILKKDIKRKKTMNIILLLFAIMASMFVSGGLSNVIIVLNGTDYFLDKAGIGDYTIIAQQDTEKLEDTLTNSKNVSGYKKEECYFLSKDNITVEDKTVEMKNNTLLIQPVWENGIKFFKTDNSELTDVERGEVYVTAGFLKKNGFEVGDRLRVQNCETDTSFKIAGEFKDALLGSDMMGNTRLLINDKDYRIYSDNEDMEAFSGSIFYIDSGDTKALASELTNVGKILFSGERSMIKLCYVMEMIIAMIVLVVSVCLVIVSFFLLKFVITFSISEEYREIGVMKAIGIKDRKIRSLYMVKYVAIACLGGIIGLMAGFPFSSVLIRSVSEKMLLGNDMGIAINLLGAALVVVIMSVFSYLCTGKVKKATPVDAIRSGQTKERYGRKSRYSIKNTHFANAIYLAVNDVISSPKRFITIIIPFFLCSIIAFGVVEVTDTMNSDGLITTFGKRSDIYITDSKLVKMTYISEDGDDAISSTYKSIENDLKKLGMPGKVSMEIWYKYPITAHGETTMITFQQNKKTHADEYEYYEGTAPKNAGEIAVTPSIADQLGVKLGDSVVIDFGSEKMECKITAYFQTLNQLGNVVRLHEDAPTNMNNTSAMMAFQIDFDDKVSEKEIGERIEKLKEFYDIQDIFDTAGYCRDCIGVVDTMESVSKLLIVITGIVVILVTVLMERSFIQEDKSQIALLKAIGFTDGFVISWHCFRFMIITIISELLAAALTYPVTKLWCDPIWKMMGATKVDYCFRPFMILVTCPGIIFMINFATVLLTALYTKKITSTDVASIE